jgi:hypothetical protein
MKRESLCSWTVRMVRAVPHEVLVGLIYETGPPKGGFSDGEQ